MEAVINRVLFSEEQIQLRVIELAGEIRRDHPGPLVLLGVLKGSLYFLSDLSRALGGDVQIDFMQVSSYGNGTKSSGVVQFKKDHEIDIQGKDVLLVEDIVDSGLTLEYLLGVLGQRRPASLRTAAMLIKPDALQREVKVDYLGFAIPNEFVVGYGLDCDEQYRALPYIAVLKSSH